MPSGTGIDQFQKEFPDRTFDVGIAEQHAITFAAGLATEGMKPFCAIYSTFLQRAYDQVVHDIAIQRLPVRFAMDRAGLVGADGPTHAGSFDVAYLGCLPGFVLMAAADEAELVHMVATQVAIDDRPSALRYPRGEGRGVPMPAEGIPLEIGCGRVLREGDKVARDLVCRQAEEICVMVVVAMRRLGLTAEPTPVVLGGGLMTARDPLLLSEITERITAAAPHASVIVVAVPPVAGAALLGLDHVGAGPAAERRLRAAYDGRAWL